MSSKQKARSRLKRLAKQIPDDAALLHGLLTWQTRGDDAADHAIAVVGAAYVEHALKVAILSRLRPERYLMEISMAPYRPFRLERN